MDLKSFPYAGEIKSLKDLDFLVKDINSSYLNLNNGIQDFYLNFRGHESIEYNLISTLFRRRDGLESILKKEKDLIKKFIKLSNEFFKENKANESIKTDIHQSWYNLAQMQHLGIPTRLLDWTIDSRVALFFAVQDKQYYTQDGDFWIFCTKDYLNLENTEQKSLDPFTIERDYFLNIPVKFHRNFESDISQRRILSQQGKFLVQTNGKTKIPMEHDPEYQFFLKRLKVPSFSKKIILKDLEYEGYTECNLYKSSNQILKILINKIFEQDPM
jgi:hypothetical protein